MPWTTRSPGINRAIQLDPGSARIHANLASLLAEQEKYDEALAGYRRALELDPTYAEAHCGLGGVRHEQGHFEQAQAHYREALRHKPDLPAAHCALGTVREELGDFPDAETLLRARRCGTTRAWPAPTRRWPRCCAASCPTTTWPPCADSLADPDLHDGRRCALHFGLAQALDARGAYDEAGESLRQANALALAGRGSAARATTRPSTPALCAA